MIIQITFRFLYKAILVVLCCALPATLLFAQQTVSRDTSSSSKKSKKIFYGQASYYANKFQGRLTANGETFSQEKLTAACNVLPLGTWVSVTNLKNGKKIIVKINDRLHPKTRRLIDLTRTGAKKLDFISRGLTRVRVEVINKHK